MQSDIVIPFLFESLPVRGALVQLQKSWQRMQFGHRYPRPVLEVLGHSAAASALIAASLRYDSLMTLQISGDGPLSMLVMQCTSALELRGMAHANDTGAGAGFRELVARANCAITVDGGDIEQPYQGIVEVRGASLAASLEQYYARSAQMPSHLALVGEPGFAGGLMLQRMPGRGAVDADDWRRLGLLAATLGPPDLGDGAGIELLARLFAEDDLRVFPGREVVFRCRCSQRRAEDVLRLLGPEETRLACRGEGRVDVTCEYCGRTRRFDDVDIARLFAGPSAPSSDRLH